MRYKDKVVLVTGGSKGIGEGCVRVFVEEGGAKVVFCARGEKEGKALEGEVNARARAGRSSCAATSRKVEDVRASSTAP